GASAAARTSRTDELDDYWRHRSTKPDRQRYARRERSRTAQLYDTATVTAAFVRVEHYTTMKTLIFEIYPVSDDDIKSIDFAEIMSAIRQNVPNGDVKVITLVAKPIQ